MPYSGAEAKRLLYPTSSVIACSNDWSRISWRISRGRFRGEPLLISAECAGVVVCVWAAAIATGPTCSSIAMMVAVTERLYDDLIGAAR